MHRKKLKLALVESEKTHWQAALEANKLLSVGFRLTEHDITRLVTGRKAPSPEQAEALALVLDCEMSDLFSEIGNGGENE